MSILQIEAGLCPMLAGSGQSHCCPVSWIKTEQGSVGLQSTYPFCVLCFLFVGYRVHSSSLTFPESQRAYSDSCLSGKGGDTEARRSNQMVVQPWGRVLVPPQGICITISLSSSAELGPPARWRMVTSGWVQDSWSTALLPYHQPIRRKLHILQLSPQILPSFSGPGDDHLVRPPVWPLSVSSPTESNSFRLNCCYYDGKCQFWVQNTSV